VSDDRARHRGIVAVALLALAASLVYLSKLSKRPRATSAPAASASSRPPERPRLAPLAADGWLVELEVPGHSSAMAAVPLGAVEARPVWVALHGGADRAEWACGTWVGVARSHPFVLCPRGAALAGGARFGWGTGAEVERELRGALKSLKSRFGAHVASGPVVLVAFGAGVKHALEISRQEPSFFSRMVLVGAEPSSWNAGQAAVYARSGGQRALFVVSDPASRAAASTYWIFARGAGLDAKLLDLGDRGLSLDAAVAKEIATGFEWLVAGDPLYADVGG
jgi:hypothetical protein